MAPSPMTQDQLEGFSRRIGALAAAETEGTGVEFQRRSAELRKLEQSARAAARDGEGSIEANLLELDMRIMIAERAAAVELAEDKNGFLGALAEEVHSWDVYVERLQVNIAATAGDGREQAEGAIRELRRHRNRLAAHTAAMTASSGDEWREAREHTHAVREEFESQVAELKATFAGGTQK